VTFDCATLGVPCDVSSPVSTLDPVVACAERAAPHRCSGPDECTSAGVVESCANGKSVSVACASVGLGPCAKGLNDLAACTAPK
jgi:hypothetical protein